MMWIHADVFIHLQCSFWHEAFCRPVVLIWPWHHPTNYKSKFSLTNNFKKMLCPALGCWNLLLLKAAPVTLHAHECCCFLLQAADRHRTPGPRQNSLRRFSPSLGMMMSQHVAANVVLPDYHQPAPQIVTSRLSAAGERRCDILGLSMWEDGAPCSPPDAMLADRRLPTRNRRSAVTSSSADASGLFRSRKSELEIIGFIKSAKIFY